jgi:hypothetical protein
MKNKFELCEEREIDSTKAAFIDVSPMRNQADEWFCFCYCTSLPLQKTLTRRLDINIVNIGLNFTKILGSCHTSVDSRQQQCHGPTLAPPTGTRHPMPHNRLQIFIITLSSSYLSNSMRMFIWACRNPSCTFLDPLWTWPWILDWLVITPFCQEWLSTKCCPPSFIM